MAISEQEFNKRVRANAEAMAWKPVVDDPMVMEALLASAETAKRRWLNLEANYLADDVERWLEANEGDV